MFRTYQWNPHRFLYKVWIVLISLCLFASLAGCSSKPKKAQDLNFKKIDFEEVSDIENINYVEDAQLFSQINKLSVKNQKDASNSKERAVVILRYLEDVYQLAGTRVSKDLDKLYMYSENYQNYIIVLQSYCEYYARDIAQITKEIRDPEFDMDNEEVFVVLGDLEDFWFEISAQIS